MSKRFSIVSSAFLILLGLVALLFSLAGSTANVRVWQLWPLTILAAGLALLLPPLLVRGKPGLGALLIPGMPVLITGSILLFASIFHQWKTWSWLWPQEVLAVALGFLFAAIYTRTIWLLIPAIVIGANGTLMQLCAITGWWRVWAVLWTIEPLSVGLALLAVYIKRRSRGLLIAGIVLCALAGVGVLGSAAITAFSTVLPAWWLWRWIGPVTLILAGAALLIWGLVRHTASLNPATG